MGGRDVVVLGGSAGSIEAVSEVVRCLPADFPAAVSVVVHFPGSVSSTLPRILSRAGPLEARHARNDELIEPGLIYVAPPDCHLQLTDDRTRLTGDAAECHGPRGGRPRSRSRRDSTAAERSRGGARSLSQGGTHVPGSHGCRAG